MSADMEFHHSGDGDRGVAARLRMPKSVSPAMRYPNSSNRIFLLMVVEAIDREGVPVKESDVRLSIVAEWDQR